MSRLGQAFALASELHATQVRKGPVAIPYIGHLMAVCSLVLEDGGSEDEAIAALLHDAVEDQGGLATLERIRHAFGEEVAEVVLACSDSTGEGKKPPWRERKEAYLAHLEEATPATLRVSLADKLHNVRSILFDLRVRGDLVWERFNRGRDQQLWYYRALADAFLRLRPGAMAEELDRVVSDLERETGAGAAPTG